ncbi:hypothetical protein M0G74_14095 [Microbulbifer sp. CAU 1566]|uniref:lipopolysaccharide biosynthesis protein n=1 Tax=Microbulbifer sp. CAU 1566 TaxID=2933269 RepID=UPI00200573B4|nr:hypothetical protein [Microbulbifer sp. CAU 1566]MCK7598408.1 hypothetical protein [Microbulbifer sp. CAU 1566]
MLNFSKLPGSILSIGEQGILSLYSFLVMAISARVLGQGDFGQFGLLWNLYPIMLLLLTAGLTKPLSLVYPMATQEVKDKQEKFMATIAMGGWWIILTSAMLFICSIYLSMDSIAPWLAGVGLLAVRMIHELHRRMYFAKQQILDVLFHGIKIHFLSIFFMPLVCYLLFTLEFKLDLVSYTAGIWLLLLIPSVFHLKKNLYGLSELKENSDVWSGLFIYGKPLIIAASIEIACKRIAPYVMAISAGALEAGAWAVGRLLVGPSQLILLGIINSALPQLRHCYAKGDLLMASAKYFQNVTLVLVLYMLPLVAIFVFAEWFIHLIIGEVYVGAVETLKIYCAAFIIMGIGSLLSLYLNALGEVRQQVPMSFASSIVYVIGLIHILGNKGGATSVAGLAFVSEVVSLAVLIFFVVKLKRKNSNLEIA